MTRVMSALKKGALLKAFAGKPEDAEKVPLPYDDRVILNNTAREVQTTSAKTNFVFSFKHVYGVVTQRHATLLKLPKTLRDESTQLLNAPGTKQSAFHSIQSVSCCTQKSLEIALIKVQNQFIYFFVNGFFVR